MRFVVDASAAASWLLKSQETASANAFLLDAQDHELEAPHLFPIEIRNVLLQSERRGRIPPGEVEGLLSTLEGIGISIASTDASGADFALDLARTEQLTVYDALYLLLALDHDAQLATRDAELIAAAVRRGVTVRDLRL
jgi:predicted nucleic acid-binding protein